MNNSQVAHLWANEAKPRASGSNFYFVGASLYSYGPHFVVGRIVRNARGERAYLLNAGTYSNSTSRHKRYAWRAIAEGETIFHVASPAGSHATIREDYKARIAASLARIPSARGARTLRDAIVGAQELTQQYNAYSQFYSLRGRLKVPTLSADDAARLALYEQREHARLTQHEAEREAERAEWQRQAAIRDAERRQEFREGKSRAYAGGIGGPCMLRLSNDGLRFETSQGADVPRDDGVAMLRFIAANLKTGRTYDDGGRAVNAGGFTLRSITAETVTIGCHQIPVSECAAMAALVGVEWPS